MEVRPDLLIIESGWTFPHDELTSRIDAVLAEGRPVYVNTNQEVWQRGGSVSREWVSLQAALQAYERDPPAPSTAPFERIRRLSSRHSP